MWRKIKSRLGRRLIRRAFRLLPDRLVCKSPDTYYARLDQALQNSAATSLRSQPYRLQIREALAESGIAERLLHRTSGLSDATTNPFFAQVFANLEPGNEETALVRAVYYLPELLGMSAVPRQVWIGYAALIGAVLPWILCAFIGAMVAETTVVWAAMLSMASLCVLLVSTVSQHKAFDNRAIHAVEFYYYLLKKLNALAREPSKDDSSEKSIAAAKDSHIQLPRRPPAYPPLNLSRISSPVASRVLAVLGRHLPAASEAKYPSTFYRKLEEGGALKQDAEFRAYSQWVRARLHAVDLAGQLVLDQEADIASPGTATTTLASLFPQQRSAGPDDRALGMLRNLNRHIGELESLTPTYLIKLRTALWVLIPLLLIAVTLGVYRAGLALKWLFPVLSAGALAAVYWGKWHARRHFLDTRRLINRVEFYYYLAARFSDPIEKNRHSPARDSRIKGREHLKVIE